MSEPVVTRFAPSPTGYLHVGGGRTALFNWLWARRTGGRFILRIEDTDQKRNTPTAARQVMTDLRWLGIEWDEGPDVGGPNGPYCQSERRDLYDKYVRQLLDAGKAYYCFETSEDLDAMRQEAEAQKTGFVFRRPAQSPSEEDARKARAEGRPVTVRFAIPQDGPIVVDDLVRGRISFNPAELADFIILKSDGFPTYNFACVVDDRLMEVTHVLRGQEHLMNTPGQQALWQAMFPDAPLPKYAHMSVTVSDSGGKLSKRERPKALRAAIQALSDPDTAKLAEAGGISEGDVQAFLSGETTPDMPAIDAIAKHFGVHLPEINIVDFFKSGYLPETLVNFLALLGWNPGDQREVMTVQELIESFDLTRLTKSNSLFDRQKLVAFNTEHLRMLPPEKVLKHLRAYLTEVRSPLLGADDETLLRIIRLCEGARTLEDIDNKSRFLFVDDDKIEFDEAAVKKVLLKGGALDILQIVRDRLATMDEYTEQALEEMLRGLAADKQVGLGKVAQPLRVALCGTTISLPIFDSVNLLGKERTLKRIDLTLTRFGSQGGGHSE
ncbi:MAG: glutamate--tRNA ligase [Sedimentisphaerales bacterium]|nr:glutamate--tRNA ligase [Sedimentisphaerales bacterium]HNY76990.1 glutamate--tRNA ligase [Sedimentisphaerales bacterium]HOC64713.1 glutamate--tRNA ligase [Sedimentisphaerales bacterium]HOH62764.1 glutamate--tRNA ligase [Sedimentisphaerales bacterium]HPY49768.1 glutamate--tRNA ligase [Sedimentisphaerales bacterium]